MSQIIIRAIRYNLSPLSNEDGTFLLHDPITGDKLVVHYQAGTCTCTEPTTGGKKCVHVTAVRNRVARGLYAAQLAGQLRDAAALVERAGAGDRDAREQLHRTAVEQQGMKFSDLDTLLQLVVADSESPTESDRRLQNGERLVRNYLRLKNANDERNGDCGEEAPQVLA